MCDKISNTIAVLDSILLAIENGRENNEPMRESDFKDIIEDLGAYLKGESDDEDTDFILPTKIRGRGQILNEQHSVKMLVNGSMRMHE